MSLGTQFFKFVLSSVCMVLPFNFASAADIPSGFVRLSIVAPQIEQDIRYYGNHNFVGRSVVGYEAPECILTIQAAEALVAVERELAPDGYGLKVYDCYRPARAVADFASWAKDLNRLEMQAEFYPRVNKADLFNLGYIATRSGHSRGSTVDLAIKRIDENNTPKWKIGDPITDCALPESERFADGILDFGTGYDCFDVKAHHGADGISLTATENRKNLADIMAKHGFKLYAEEWWHYTLIDEPFSDTYFDFPVTAVSE